MDYIFHGHKNLCDNWINKKEYFLDLYSVFLLFDCTNNMCAVELAFEAEEAMIFVFKILFAFLEALDLKIGLIHILTIVWVKS